MKIPYPLNRLLLDLGHEKTSVGQAALVSSRLRKLAETAYAVLFLTDRPPLPIRLQVENTNRCNLCCIMCGRQFRSVFNKDMSNDLFEKLITEIRPAYLTINGDGEPMLDPGLVTKIRTAKSLRCIVTMPSNMTLADENKTRSLLESGLDLLTFSLDGATKETYEGIRIGANFEEVVENILRCIALAKEQRNFPPPELRVLFVLQNQNVHEYEACLTLQRKLGLKIQLVPVKYLDQKEVAASCAASASALVDLEKALQLKLQEDLSPDAQELYKRWLNVARKMCVSTPPGKVCLKPWTTSYIDARGDVYPCCLAVDEKQSLKMGSVLTDSFRSVWHGEKYQAYRKNMLGARGQVPICAGCPAGDEGLHTKFRHWFRWLPAPIHRAWRT